MNTISKYLFKPEIIFSALSALVLWMSMSSSSYFTILFALSLGLLYIATQKFIYGLWLFLFMLPFTGVKIFDSNLANLPGIKILQLFTVFIILLAFFKYHQANNLPRYALVFTIIFLALFSFSIGRSLLHLSTLNAYSEDKLSAVRFILSYLVKPLIYFLPFILIIKFAHRPRLFEGTVKIIGASVVLLSLVMLYLYFFKVEANSHVDVVNRQYQKFFGIHRNDLANFYLLGIPILLTLYFLKKNLFNAISVVIAVAAASFTFSRTAYAIILLSFLFYLFISGRKRFLPILLTLAFIVSFFVSANIIERSYHGLDSGDRNIITAGRIDDIWLPLIEEYGRHPGKLLVGNGRYSIITSEANRKGLIHVTGHPHNMFLELILDCGLLGLIAIISFFVILYRKIFEKLRYLRDRRLREYYCGIMIALSAYLLAGLTGRSFFPQLLSSYFWIIAGLAVAMLAFQDLSGKEVDESA